MIVNKSSPQSWINDMIDAEFRPLKKCAVAALGDISKFRGSRPDWVAVIVDLFGKWKVGKFYVVFTLCKIPASCCIQ